MEDRDCKKILHNLNSLVKFTNMETLLPLLVSKGVFTERMIQKYRIETVPLSRRLVDMYVDLTLRGPHAFTNLVDALSESGHVHLAIELEAEQGDVENEVNPRIHPLILPQYAQGMNEICRNHIPETAPNDGFNVGMEPFRINVRQATNWVDNRNIHGDRPDVYPVVSNPKGYLLLINNVKFINDVKDERRGAEIDEENLKTLFQQLGYKVLIHRDLNIKDMKKVIKDFANLREHRLVDSCFLSIMSHGNCGNDRNGSTFYACDGNQLSVEWILRQFANDKCPNLQNKPKVFLFQSCRGDEDDNGTTKASTWTRTQTDGQPKKSLRFRTNSDMLIAYSTIPGYTSNRDIYKGTWFIQAVCKIFMDHAYNTDIEDMLKMVDQKLAHSISDHNVMQTSCYENRGFRKFYFNPGLYSS